MSTLTRIASRLLRLPPATHPDLVQQADLPMTTSDGVVLLAHRWVPRGYENGGLPTLLMRSPYGRRGVMAFEAPLLAERGYNVLIQSVRGTHGSGGTFEPFVHDRSDGAEALAWLHEQPWCDGAVGTWGGSYCGYTQLATAASVGSELLSAMVIDVSSADLRCLFKPYGAFTLDSAGGWVYGLDPGGTRKPLASIRHMLSGGDVKKQARAHLPLREADLLLAGKEQPFFRDWVDSSLVSSYWDHLDVRTGHVAQHAPIAIHAGWFDIFAPGQLEDASALLETGRDVRVVVGPWHHAGGMAPRFRDTLRHFDQALRGAPAPTDRRPVRVQLYGDKRWWALSTWPAPSQQHEWFLTADRRLDAESPGATGKVEWVDDPADPAPSRGGAVLQGGGAKDNADRESRPDVITFTSPPLDADFVVLGTPRVTARAGADVESYDVVVRLCLVDEKGVSRNVSDGMQRVDGGDADVDITMWPIGVRVRRGERLRLQVAGSLHPMWARNLHTGEDPGKGTTSVVAHQSLLLGEAAPAVLELPVVQLGAGDLAHDM
jgi:putative CocE/NonD family hydrolase